MITNTEGANAVKACEEHVERLKEELRQAERDLHFARDNMGWKHVGDWSWEFSKGQKSIAVQQHGANGVKLTAKYEGGGPLVDVQFVGLDAVAFRDILNTIVDLPPVPLLPDLDDAPLEIPEGYRAVIIWKGRTPRLAASLLDVKKGETFQLVPVDDNDAKIAWITFGASVALCDGYVREDGHSTIDCSSPRQQQVELTNISLEIPELGVEELAEAVAKAAGVPCHAQPDAQEPVACEHPWHKFPIEGRPCPDCDAQFTEQNREEILPLDAVKSTLVTGHRYYVSVKGDKLKLLTWYRLQAEPSFIEPDITNPSFSHVVTDVIGVKCVGGVPLSPEASTLCEREFARTKAPK